MNSLKKYIKYLLLSFLLLCCGCSNTMNENIVINNLHQLKYVGGTFDFDLHSGSYLLADLSDFEILYGYENSKQIYPASLTKVLTLDTVLNIVDDLDEMSYVTSDQVEDLIREDASLAYIQRDYPYPIRDLLYALVLPSGADAAVALENYFDYLGLDLVEEMNKQATKLGCQNSNFTNTTGLHDDNLYTSLDDLLLITLDVLKYEEGRKILESLYYYCYDGISFSSSIFYLNRSKVLALGGKTGYTPEAGQNVIVLYKYRGRSYILLLANAMGSYANGDMWHFDDALTVFEHLYQ